MPIAKETKTFDPAPAGTHVARCYGCISLGTQHSDMYADTFKVMLLFELPYELIQTQDGEKPMTVSKEYTLSLGKKANLRKHLDSWRGRAFSQDELDGFEVANVVGAPCQLTIVHGTSNKGSTYAKIESITGLAKGMQCPPQVHQSVKFEIEEGQTDGFKALPEWIRNKILACEEWAPKTPGQSAPASTEEDDVPMGDDPEVPF